MVYFDCNLHLEQFSSPISVLKEYLHYNVENIINLCNSDKDFYFLKELIPQKYKVLFGIGLHPNINYSQMQTETILKIIQDDVEIIGECGLDFTNNINSINTQISNLKIQLEIAEKGNKIIIIHMRRAENKIIEILDTYKLKYVIFHWYSGPILEMKKLLERGYYFSYNNCILYYTKYSDYLEKIPLTKILLESDAPYSYNDRITQPYDFPKIIEFISKIKSKNIEIVKEILNQNFKKIFGNLF